MTPNKLPPLPEWMSKFMIPNDAFDGSSDQWLADRMHAYAAEALRQSQSLPAGAGAGLVQKWRHEAGLFRELGGDISNAEAALFCVLADELEQALQADAREKGEAVAWVDPDELRLCQEFGGMLVATAHAEPESGRSLGLYATQPAQASEKDNEAT